jgi:CTP synthase (UTP-ammonia lyase)
MAWSYDATNLGTASTAERINSVRLLVGDTDTNDQQVQNEEITFALNQTNDNVYYAAAWAARTIAAQYSRRVTQNLSGALSADYSDLQEHYTSLAETLEHQGKKSGAVVGIKAGGISIAIVDNVRQNTDRIAPSFRRDRFRNPPSYSGDDYDYN